MQRMVRKQIYIGKDQDKALKRAARVSGVSQAELIRRGIGKGITEIAEIPAGNDLDWAKALKVMKDRARARVLAKGNRTWKREDLYDR